MLLIQMTVYKEQLGLERQMKKIKYANKKTVTDKSDIDILKNGDDGICGAVLDTLSDDYLSYISHLVKNNKTPLKSQLEPFNEQYQSSDSQSLSQGEPPKQPHLHPNQLHKVRHHSEAASKTMPLKKNKPFKQSSPQQIKHHSGHQTIFLDSNSQELLKYNQKTLIFTQNHRPLKAQQPNQIKKRHFSVQKNQREKIKSEYSTNLIKNRLNTQQLLQKDQHKSVSINVTEDNFQFPQHVEQSVKFITNIDQYLVNLQNNVSKKDGESCDGQKLFKKMNSQRNREIQLKLKKQNKRLPKEEIQRYQINEILKENIKLKKKVKDFKQKITDLEDEICNHLVHCKKREKSNKEKVNELVKALTQAISKISLQKNQIVSMKDLLKCFGQRAKQYDYENSDSQDIQEDLSNSIVKMLIPKNNGDFRTKNKKSLESTMPRYDEEKSKFW